MNRIDNRELLAAARAWAEAYYPGCPLESISLRLRYLPAPVRLVEGPIGSPRTETETELEERGHGGLDACTRDILGALRSSSRPLTKTRLLEVMMERLHRGEGGEWSERTVCRRLAELLADGTIENPSDARPRGYRLAE